MSEGCIGVSVEGGCVGVSVEDPGVPNITVGCCEQGPPGAPGGNGRVPFYLSNGVAEFMDLVTGEIPFYLSDGTSEFIGVL